MKVTLSDVTNILGNPTSAQNTINQNNDVIENAFENTLSRDGTTPNQMLSDLDMNNNDIINVKSIDTDELTIDGGPIAGLESLQGAYADVLDAVAAAEAAAAAAEQSAEDAAGSASQYPPIVDNTMLVDLAGVRSSRTFAQVRTHLGVQAITGTPVLNSMVVGKADGTLEVQTRDLSREQLNLVGIEQSKLLLFGFRPDLLSENVIRLQPGVAATGEVTPVSFINSYTTIDVDLTKTGKNGMDTGAPVAGLDYFIYLIKNPTTSEVAAVISHQISTSLVTKPAGFTLIRKLPFGFIYGLGFTGGVPAYHLSNWPHPRVDYTDSSFDAKWRCLNAGVATSMTTFDLAGFIPDNARWVHLMFHLQGTVAAKAYSRSSGTGASGKLVGTITPNTESVVYTSLRVTSAAQLFYRVTSASANLSIYVTGYSQTEIS